MQHKTVDFMLQIHVLQHKYGAKVQNFFGIYN